MKRLLLTILVLLSAGAALAQNNVKYQGRVLSQDSREPLEGVAVMVVGTQIGTTTDSKGSFLINGPADATLQVKFMGYQTQEIRGIPGTPVQIQMKADETVMDEVVMVGYGSAKKSELTTSSSGIRASEMQTEGTTSFEQAIQGKLSGVVITNTEGQPGSSISMEIRGVSSLSGSIEPLYVIDGVIIDSNDNLTSQQGGFNLGSGMGAMNPLASLNPNDIASMEILKDAAATAIYGSRGANGVVLITTKSGQVGKAKVNFNYNQGFSTSIKKIEVLSPREFSDLRWYTKGQTIDEALLASIPDSRTRWQDVTLRPNAPSSEFSLSVSGGTKGFTYMISGNYLDQQGVVINSGFQRMSLRANFNFDLSTNTKMTFKSTYMRGIYNSVATSVGNGDVDQTGIIKLSLIKPPNIRLREDFAEDDSEDISEQLNPYTAAMDPTRLTTNDRLVSALTLETKLAKNLTFKPLLGIDYTLSLADTYYPPTVQQGKPSAGLQDQGFGQQSFTRTVNWSSENQLTYTNTFAGKHSLTAMAVFSAYENGRRPLNASSRGYINDDLVMYALQNGLSSTYKINTVPQRSALLSFTGRVNYGYDKRYLFTASLRADGSSRFGSDRRWGYFPTVSAAWNANNEKFLSGFFRRYQVNNARLRLSWGVVGNQSIPINQALSTLSVNVYQGPNGTVPSVTPSRIANPWLGWEQSKQSNIGVDLGVFRDRITLNYNFYNKITTALLQNINIPPSTGFSQQYQNSGTIRNRGHEFEVNARAIENKNFSWVVAANISFNKNRILDLGGIDHQFTQNLGSGGSVNWTPFIQKVGYSIGTLWGWQTDGVYQRPSDFADITESVPHGLAAEDAGAVRNAKMVGEIRIIDQNHDGKIDDDDKVKIGDVNPKYTFGITNTFTYKYLSLMVFFQGKVGGDIYNQVFSVLENMGGGGQLTPAAYYGRWQGEGTSNYYPKLNTTNAIKYDPYDRSVEDGTYVRLKAVRLSFNFTSKLLGLPKFPSGSIYLSVDNAITWTKYRGFDPEVSSFGRNAAFRGVDMGAYPQNRTWGGGISLSF